jgi:alginate O-acetyltransferase complex protein AlgI
LDLKHPMMYSLGNKKLHLLVEFRKYYNFFAASFSSVFTMLGYPVTTSSLEIILPVGVSFYTFQTLSYSIDVYRRKLEPINDIVAFFAFVSFFPQLVAGPIERATNLLPQFCKMRKFEYSKAVDGMRQILWGLFKKLVIADNCAEFADLIFDNSNELPGSALVLGAIFFAFQIYGDFSGYSDIAIGTSRLFGFNLRRNFAFPYFSRDIAEFWRRWHISLSSWFRDYLYIPLGGSQVRYSKKVRNIFLIFIVSGLWHGANWTYVWWGVLNAVYFLPLLLSNRNRRNIGIVAEGRFLPNLTETFSMIFTFSLTTFAWIFFRAESVNHAVSYISGIFSWTLFTFPDNIFGGESLITIVLIVLFLIIEWIGREMEYGISNFGIQRNTTLRWSYYLVIIFLIFWFQGDKQEFIYFQF